MRGTLDLKICKIIADDQVFMTEKTPWKNIKFSPRKGLSHMHEFEHSIMSHENSHLGIPTSYACRLSITEDFCLMFGFGKSAIT